MKKSKFALTYFKSMLLLAFVTYYRDEDFMYKVGQRLKQIREDKGLGQEELSLNSGFSQSQVGRTERAETNTSISHIAALARTLGIHPRELFDVEFNYDHKNSKKIIDNRSKRNNNS